ncbi:CBD9-like protein [Trichodelitschia bisporula]|uniref:CBD9-like protein n=1 Tax=Trichodelitschia bisporula TaxID=703511 RepID=A0A6G1HWQ8_9PEZI|nr:CBD9-like protein [Trichodelitschia bisporula]
MAGLLSTLAQAAGSATFVYSFDETNFTVSLSAVADTGDLYFRVQAPSGFDWIAVGIGASMKNALMFLAYPSKSGTNITFSPRLSTGNTEPAYSSAINARLMTNTSEPGSNHVDSLDSTAGVYSLEFICFNCTHFSNPPLDLTSAAAPFMFAVGPPSSSSVRASNSPAAPLRSHALHGQFTFDMRAATSPNSDNVGIPALGLKASDSNPGPVKVTRHDWIGAAHAAIMCLAFAFWLPVDAMLFRLMRRWKLHMYLQGAFALFFVVGLGLGIHLSTLFVRSKSYNTAHQVLGLIVIFVILAQAGLGYLRLRTHLATRTVDPSAHPTKVPDLAPRKNPTRLLHPLLGLLTFVLGVTAAGLGFPLALSPGYNRVWGPLVVAVVIMYLFAFGAKYCWASHGKDMKDEQATERNLQEAYDYGAQQRQRQAPAYGAPGFGAQYQGQQPVELGQYPQGSVPIPGQYQQASVPIPGRY